MTKEIVTAGPALLAAARPVIENSPAPMIAPMPSATRLPAPSAALESIGLTSLFILLNDRFYRFDFK
jgi:hypothetical protein